MYPFLYATTPRYIARMGLNYVEFLKLIGFYHAPIYNDDTPPWWGFTYMNCVIFDYFQASYHTFSYHTMVILEYDWI